MVYLNFETITPLHISNGNELAYNIDYIITGDQFGKFNLNKVSRVLAENNIFDFSKSYNYNQFIKIIEENIQLFDNFHFDYNIFATSSFLEQIRNERAVGKKIVQEFINSNGKFYIPASSIKGALLTVLHFDSLGISIANPDINHKFVLSDSDFIDEENFSVDRTSDRPPAINLITLSTGNLFTLKIKKLGTLDINILKEKLSFYSIGQIEKAMEIVKKFKSRNPRNPKGADKYYEILLNLSKENLEKDEYLINIGFGGGSWFKIFADSIPKKFKNPGKRGRIYEEAHTTFSIPIENELYQLGWCKLKIEEK